MAEENIKNLDLDLLDLLARKGHEDNPPQANNPNAVCVRRIVQLAGDLCGDPLPEANVLDLACGEGAYAIETALRGARVLGVDGRDQRMNIGRMIAERLGLSNLKFEHLDVRKVSRETHGTFDIVYFLGILYHLDFPDSLHVLEKIHELCREFVIIDTSTSPYSDSVVEYGGREYEGSQKAEHGESDPAELRLSRTHMSLDNPYAFLFTKSSLVRILKDVGFSSVLECHCPLEPTKAARRVTLAAFKREPIKLYTYPWINGKTENEIAELLGASETPVHASTGKQLKTLSNILREGLDGMLRPFGYRITRL